MRSCLSKTTLTFLRRRFPLLLLFILSGPYLVAQAFKASYFDEESGLEPEYVYAIAQDSLDYLWIGTENGLVRFNGADFVRFGEKEGLAEDFVTALYRDQQGLIWVGHNKGATSKVIGHKEVHTLPNARFNSAIIGFAETPQHEIWVASQRDGLALLHLDGKVERLDPGSIGPVYSIAAKGEDLLIGTDSGLYLYDKSKKESISLLEDVHVVRIRPLRGGTWLCAEAEEKLFRYDPQNGQTIYLPSLEAGFAITDCIEDRKGRIWVSGRDRGFRVFAPNGESYRPVEIINDLESHSRMLKTVYEDRFGQIWLGSYGQGLVSLTEEYFSYFMPSEGQEAFSVVATEKGHYFGLERSMCYSPDSLLGGPGEPLQIGNGMELRCSAQYDSLSGLDGRPVSALTVSDEGILYIATDGGGVWRLSEGTPTLLPGPEDPLQRRVTLMRQDMGYLYAGTYGGLLRYNLRNGDGTEMPDLFTSRAGLGHNFINDLLADSLRRMWVCHKTNSLSLYKAYRRDDRFEVLDLPEAMRKSEFNCVSVAGSRDVWLGTNGQGVIRFDGKEYRMYGLKDGLLSPFCYRLLTTRDGTIWAIHRNGISRYLPGRDEWFPYPYEQILPFKEAAPHQVYEAPDGNIWLALSTGLVRYRPDMDPLGKTPPRILMTGMDLQGESAEMVSGLELDYDDYRIRFQFEGISFTDQSNLRYQYILEGRDQQWSAPSPLNEATYQGLLDGKYTFRVRALDRLGNSSREVAVYSFRIRRPFWKAWWFRGLIALLLLVLIYLFIQYRTYRLNREKEELEEKVNVRTKELLEEKEKVEKANQELEKLSLVASGTDNAVFILDKEGNLEYVNEGFRRLSGYTLEEVRSLVSGMHFLEISANPDIEQILEESIRDKTSVMYESKLPNKYDKDIYVLSTLTPLLDEQGNVKHIVIIDSNITERKLAEERIAQMNTELEKLVDQRTEQLKQAYAELQDENEEHIKTAARLKEINEELDTFVYRASHDLKGPLASLEGLVNLSLGQVEDDQQRSYLHLMERSVRRLDSILMDLLQATRIKEARLQFKTFSLRYVLADLIASLRHGSDFRQVHVETDIPRDFELNTDTNLLNAMLQNLLDNAVKYREAGREQAKVRISAYSEKDMRVIEIRDNGRGIPKDVQANIFDMFFRGTQDSKGSGLGLYIVKKAADRLGGRIEVESTVGEGTTFRLVLPADPPEDT